MNEAASSGKAPSLLYGEGPGPGTVRGLPELALVEISLEDADQCDIPDLDLEATYLCLIGGSFHSGRFSRREDGVAKAWLSFLSWHGRPLAFNRPGYNHSNWQAIWRIENAEEIAERHRLAKERAIGN